MRGALDGLPTAHPLEQRLPTVFRDDDFTVRFVGAFDEVLAPILSTLDCLADYLDPALAPPDFVAWLAGWVACDLDESWPVQRQRALVARAVDLHRWRGTPRGLAEQVRLFTGGEVTVTDSGGCVWSSSSGGALPGRTGPAVRVTVLAAGVDEARLRAVVAGAVPAHVSCTVEVRQS
jgi:phage tail-like protein